MEIKGFTGIDDPYEVPVGADLVLEGATGSSWDFARRIVGHLLTGATCPGGEGTREMTPPTSWQRGWFRGRPADVGEGGGVEWVSRSAQPAGVQVICVLALHRAGTSRVTRIINLLGVYLGPEDHLQ